MKDYTVFANKTNFNVLSINNTNNKDKTNEHQRHETCLRNTPGETTPSIPKKPENIRIKRTESGK